ncbi:MAG: polyphosphate kinase 1 [Acidimicrobiales bacterium]
MSDPPGFEVIAREGARDVSISVWEREPSPDAELARRKARREAVESLGAARFTNRELSRLDFGARLLDLAQDDRLALLERVKFMAIFAEGLDDFFQVRVSGLEDQVAASVTTPSDDGLRPSEQLRAIAARVEELVARQDQIFLDALAPQLATAGIALSDWSSLDSSDRRYLDEVYEREMYPVLTPLAVDTSHPFPYISNLSLNLLVEMGDPGTGEHRIARVKIPPVLPRFVSMPDGERFVALEQVIAAHLDTLFPGMTIGGHDVFRVTRNADLRFEEDTDDLMVAIELELRQRRFGRAVRLEIARGAQAQTRQLLASQLSLGEDNVYVIAAPIDLGALWALYGLDRPDLHAKSWTPMTPPPLAVGGDTADIFAVLAERDILVHHPYESFASSVEAFVAQAADDPDVIGIKQTLYRTSGDSPIVASLIRAAERGKQVATVVELRARFDEQANIGWAKALEEAGVHVVYGLVGLKTHSKMCLVLRREEEKIRRYCHIGTGNYTSKTARSYEDLGLLTADSQIGADLGDLFNHLTGYSHHSDYRQIVVSPVATRETIIELIDSQAALGPEGRIVFKLNGLTDPAVIDALYGASMAGVRIDLIVRGLCSIRPQIQGLSESISVRCVVGEFLEHSRIYCFGSRTPGGSLGESPPASAGTRRQEPQEASPRIYIGSSDLMRRNLDRRIEVLVPVSDERLVARLLEVLELALHDDTNSWTLEADGKWARVPTVASSSLQAELKELALGRVRRRRDIETRAQPPKGL